MSIVHEPMNELIDQPWLAWDDSKIASEKQMLQKWHEMLESSGYFRGRSHCIQSRFRDGVLRLNGIVPTWYLKQILQKLAAQCPGVKRISNQVQVFEPSPEIVI